MTQHNPDQISANRATCKQWAVIIAVAILMVTALSRLNTASALWMAAPLAMFWLAEAGYFAHERRCVEVLKRGTENAPSAGLPPESAMTSVWRFWRTAFSLSIWPFYLALGGLVLAAAFNLPRFAPPPLAGGATNGAPQGSSPRFQPEVMPRYPDVMQYKGAGNPKFSYPGQAVRTPGASFARPLTPPPLSGLKPPGRSLAVPSGVPAVTSPAPPKALVTPSAGTP